MQVVAGVDVGNSTTEVVLAGSDGVPIAWDRMPTRGSKGSVESWQHAARLLSRLERRSGIEADVIGVTRQHAVITRALWVPPELPDLGPLSILGGRGRSPGGSGYGVGSPALVEGPEPPPRLPVVVLVPATVGFRSAVETISRWMAVGVVVVGVATAADEAVLIANRLAAHLPVLDEADVAAAAGSELLAIEVAEPGHGLRLLADPVHLAAVFPQATAAQRDAAAHAVTGARAALLGVRPDRPDRPDNPPGPWVRFADEQPVPMRTAISDDRRAVEWFDGAAAQPVADWFAVDLDAAAAAVWARPPDGGLAVAALSQGPTAAADPIAVVGADRPGQVVLVDSEPAAARAGALTTPGAAAGAVVLDLGAGTVDAMSGTASITLAGAGELLTLAVGRSLGVPRGAADWVKRGPAGRLEGPHVIAAENGDRQFLGAPAAPDAVGALVVSGPAGLLPFNRSMALSEWRALRLRLKSDTLGRNIGRALRGMDVSELIVVGGPAGDEELLASLRERVPGVVVGRGDVAGRLGHRWAVAYGLCLLA